MRERNLDTTLIEYLLHTPAKLPPHGPLPDGFGGNPGLDNYGRIRELIHS